MDELNQMPEVVLILKVIEHSYALIIIFDFDRDTVDKIVFCPRNDNHPLLIKYSKIYDNLFDFFQKQVAVEIEEYTGDPEHFKSFRDVQQLIDRLGNMKEFADIKLKPIDFNIIVSSSIHNCQFT